MTTTEATMRKRDVAQAKLIYWLNRHEEFTQAYRAATTPEQRERCARWIAVSRACVVRSVRRVRRATVIA